MTDDELLELVEQDYHYNDGIGAYVKVTVNDVYLSVRVADEQRETVRVWRLDEP